MNETIDIGLENAKEEIIDVSKELLVLRLAFGKLKAAIADAAAPINAVLITALQKAVFWAIRLVKDVGAVIAALFGVKVAQTQIEKAAAGSAKAIKRSLAGFDQLERLNGSTGVGGSVAEITVEMDPELPAHLQPIVAKIQELLQPLRELDFLPLQWNLARLGESFAQTRELIGGAVEWLWYNLLTPFAAWVVEQLAPVFTGSLKQALDAVNAALAPLGAGFTLLWQAMQPVFAFVGQTVLVVLDQLGRMFGDLATTLGEKGTVIVEIFRNIGTCITALWEGAEPILTALRTLWAMTFGDMSGTLAQIVGYMLDSLHGLTEFLAGAFTGDWEQAWEGIKEMLKGVLNGIIGFLNMVLTGLTGAVNAVITVANRLKFTVPDWVPKIGGQTFGFKFKTVTAPQIPYLAQGAVLPANKPFLAMVGDQRHGTNIEAPLATIQQAVASVMQDQTQGLLAGFEMSVGVQKEILQAILGIQIGDEVIGSAARRYQQKLAVVSGRGY